MALNSLDYIFLVVILIAGLWGLKRGLIASLMGIVGYVVAFWLAKAMSPTIANILTKTAFANSVRTAIMNRFSQAGFVGIEQFDLAAVAQNVELSSYFSDNPIINNLLEKQSALVSTGQNVVDMLLTYFFQCMAALVIFIIVKVIISFFSTALSSLTRTSSTLSAANRLGGLIFGSLGGIMLSAISIAVLLPVLMTYNPTVDSLVQNSVLTQRILNLLGSVIS